MGRVVRFDSVSKILSAGIRIGFACGPLPIMAAIDAHVRRPLSLSLPLFAVSRVSRALT